MNIIIYIFFCCLKIAKTFTLFIIYIYSTREPATQHSYFIHTEKWYCCSLVKFIYIYIYIFIYSFSFPHTQSTSTTHKLMPSPFNTPQTLWLFQWLGILSNFHNNLVRFSNGCAKHKKHKISISFITIINIIFYFIFIFSPFFLFLCFFVSFFCSRRIYLYLIIVLVYMLCVYVWSKRRYTFLWKIQFFLFVCLIPSLKVLSLSLLHSLNNTSAQKRREKKCRKYIYYIKEENCSIR